MSEHHGQHARCRACGTNPRAREEAQAFEPSVDTLCAECGATRSWVWSRKLERSVLRSCPCRAPKGDKSAAQERIAAIRATLPPPTRHRTTTPPLRRSGPTLKERAAERDRKAKKEQT